MLPDLARNNLVYAIDLPGYDSSYEPPDYSPAFTASFVNSFLDAVRAERAVVVGSSFGGLVALHFFGQSLSMTSSLVMLQAFSDQASYGGRAGQPLDRSRRKLSPNELLDSNILASLI